MLFIARFNWHAFPCFSGTEKQVSGNYGKDSNCSNSLSSLHYRPHKHALLSTFVFLIAKLCFFPLSTLSSLISFGCLFLVSLLYSCWLFPVYSFLILSSPLALNVAFLQTQRPQHDYPKEPIPTWT